MLNRLHIFSYFPKSPHFSFFEGVAAIKRHKRFA
nr:MAG TPA: hypothetical protein [Caudoviricetes sp.]